MNVAHEKGTQQNSIGRNSNNIKLLFSYSYHKEKYKPKVMNTLMKLLSDIKILKKYQLEIVLDFILILRNYFLIHPKLWKNME